MNSELMMLEKKQFVLMEDETKSQLGDPEYLCVSNCCILNVIARIRSLLQKLSLSANQDNNMPFINTKSSLSTQWTRG